MPRRSRYGGKDDDDMKVDEPAAAAAPAPVPGVNDKPLPARPEGVSGPVNQQGEFGGRRRHSRRRHHRHRKTLRAVPKGVHVKAKTLKRLLKSKGLKVSGKKATLRARARKAHLIRGGEEA